MIMINNDKKKDAERRYRYCMIQCDCLKISRNHFENIRRRRDFFTQANTPRIGDYQDTRIRLKCMILHTVHVQQKKIYRCDREIASEVQRPQLNLCATKEV